MPESIAKPFVKWAGGKRQLLSELKNRLPQSYNRYIEPFVGGGALYFSLVPDRATIADSNAELINTYRVIRDKVEALIADLTRQSVTPAYFTEIRAADRAKEYIYWSDVKKASRFIYLNKTCYNGLYRVNQGGFFNVPFGRYKNPAICDAENLRACAKRLKNAEILCGDFGVIEAIAKPGDLVYFDPPYAPLNAQSFTSYTVQGFDFTMQSRLKELCDRLSANGVQIMLSNAPIESILELYKDYNIHSVEANRAINSNAAQRGKIKELIVTNY